jgi:hypothetical protein
MRWRIISGESGDNGYPPESIEKNVPSQILGFRNEMN